MHSNLLNQIKKTGLNPEDLQKIIDLPAGATQQELQNKLNQIYPQLGLGMTLEVLYEQQIKSGFVGDTLEGVKFSNLFDRDYGINFSAMFNPKREERAKGFGLSKPPEGSGFNRVNEGCFLCLENIFWQQQGKQKGYYWNPVQSINEYNILPNPFPIFPRHFTLASAAHVIQRINIDHLRDMLQFLDESGDYVIFFNGQDAGASIPWHMHMQAFIQELPIEQARDRIVILDNSVKISLLNYPAPVIKICGCDKYLIDLCGNMIETRWIQADPNYHNTLNFIGTKRNGEYQIYLVLRDILKTKTRWMKGLAASVEMGGVIVWSHPDDRFKFDNFEIGYEIENEGKKQLINGLNIIKGIMADVSPEPRTVNNLINNIDWAKTIK